MAVLFNLVLIPQSGTMGAAIVLLRTWCLGTTIAVILAYQCFGPLLHFPAGPVQLEDNSCISKGFEAMFT
jgi:hypothetical protein